MGRCKERLRELTSEAEALEAAAGQPGEAESESEVEGMRAAAEKARRKWDKGRLGLAELNRQVPSLHSSVKCETTEAF